MHEDNLTSNGLRLQKLVFRTMMNIQRRCWPKNNTLRNVLKVDIDETDFL